MHGFFNWPLPPTDLQQSCDDLLVKAHAYNARGIASDNGIRRHVLTDDGTSTDAYTIAHGDPGKHDGAMPDPDVVTYDRRALCMRMSILAGTRGIQCDP